MQKTQEASVGRSDGRHNATSNDGEDDEESKEETVEHPRQLPPRPHRLKHTNCTDSQNHLLYRVFQNDVIIPHRDTDVSIVMHRRVG